MIVPRKNILRDLLIGIYLTERINYKDNQIFVGDNFLLNRCDFSKENKYYSYRGQFEELFKLTFCRPSAFFGIDINGSNCKPDKLKKGQTQFTTGHAIRNTYHFLKDQGVNFDILGNPDFQDIEFWGHLFFDILCVYLEYLFDTDLSDDCADIQMLSKKLFTRVTLQGSV